MVKRFGSGSFGVVLWSAWLVLLGATAFPCFAEPKADSNSQQPMAQVAQPPARIRNAVPLSWLIDQRREQKAPAPLIIQIHGDQNPIIGTPVGLPALKVSLKNVDAEKSSVYLSPTTDYRSGRLPKWRIVLTNADGKEVPVRGSLSWHGGGILHTTTLKPGETWDTTLPMASYVQYPPPGKYRLKVLFSDRESIVDKGDISNVVCCESKTIDFVMAKLPTKISAVDAAVVRRLIADLDEKKPVRLVAGTYGAWAHDLVSKDSPAGQLMALGPIAVPQIVEATQDKSLSPEKRAWQLAILYSITGQNDPRGPLGISGILGDYESREGPWQVFGSKEGEFPQGGFGYSETGSFRGGKIDTKAQFEFASIWTEWVKQNCDDTKSPE
jgi:hypothetical protein